MASGRQYTLSVLLKMAGQQPAKKALDSLSSGLKDVRENAKGASSAVADSARSAAGASTSWRLLGRTVRAGVSGVAFAAKGVGSVVKTGLLLPFRAATLAAGVLKGALLGLAGVAVSTWLQIKGAMAALRPAAEMEQYSIQLEVLTKSEAVALRRLAQLKEYARTTNFSPKEVIEASNLMQAFGLWTEKGMRRLRAAGDAANAFGKSITEVVTAMNYLSSGRSGEAFEALSRIGVTRQALKPLGLEFKKSGELITEPKKAVDIVFAYLERQFGGMTARQSRTWKGALQKSGGEVFNTLADGMQGALKPMTAFVNSKLTPAINAIGKALKQIDWQKTLAKPLSMLGGLLGAIRLAADPATRSTGIEQLKGIVKDMAAVGKAAFNGLGGIVSGLLKDGAAMLENFITGGGVQSVMKTLFAGLVSAFRFGTAIFRATLDGFSDKFRSDLLSVMPGSSGDYERRKRSNMMAQTFAELFPAESARIMADKRLSHRPPDSMFGGEWVPLSEAVTQERRMNAMKAYVNGLTGSARSKWESEFSRNMGWNEGRRQSSVNYFEGVLDPLKEAAKDTASRVKGLRLDNTGEAVKKAAGGIVDALGAVSGRLRRLDLMDDVQARRRALRQTVNRELDKLKKQGWDSKGRERDTERGLRARGKYTRLLNTARAQDVRLYSMLPQGEGIVPQQGRMVAKRGNPQAARYIPPQIADKARQSGKDAAKDAKQEADNMRRDAADKATIQSAVLLDDIRRMMARLATYLGQDFGMATATPDATN